MVWHASTCPTHCDRLLWTASPPQTGGGKQKASSQPKKSFYIEEDSEGEEETDGAVERSDSDSDDDMFNLFGPARLSPPPEEGEEDVDAAISL